MHEGQPERETLAHVINHCDMPAVTRRHNEIVAHVKAAAVNNAWEVVAENQVWGPHGLRPDLVLQNRAATEILIVDVTCPFEGSRGAMDEAREEKLRKYAPTLAHARGLANTARVLPIVIGALGAWDKANDAALKILANKNFINTLRKATIAAAIRHSRDIYDRHTGGPRARSALQRE